MIEDCCQIILYGYTQEIIGERKLERLNYHRMPGLCHLLVKAPEETGAVEYI